MIEDEAISLITDEQIYEQLKYRHSWQYKVDRWKTNQARKRWYTWAKYGFVFGLAAGASWAGILLAVRGGW